MPNRPDDIVGYQFNAGLFCTTCIVKELPTGPGEKFDGWAICGNPNVNAFGRPFSVEDNLNEIAAHFGIDRDDENTFDSCDFPKVILRDQADDDYDIECFLCGTTLPEQFSDN